MDMQEILDAILAEQFDELGSLAIPKQYRAVTVRADAAYRVLVFAQRGGHEAG
jgi:hypothetical protein